MCGIVGYIGKKISIKQHVNILKNLEYRGYDSSGVAYINKGQICVKKSVGPINNLIKNLGDNASKVCICHTRWATHGLASENNAHPQLSPSTNFAVVHNGIIENYNQLKKSFNLSNFSSQTDTEVICHLLDKFDGDSLHKIQQTIGHLRGSFALAIMDRSNKYLYATTHKSPLYVSKTKGGYLVASDISCFDGEFYYRLIDGVVAKISQHKVEFFKNEKKIELPQYKNDLNIKQANLDGYDHFMQKEIAETKITLQTIATRYDTIFDNLFSPKMFDKFDQIYLVGCGTAFHACQMGELWFSKKVKTQTRAVIASEFRYSEQKINDKTLAILVSQSGETADTLAVAQLCKENNATCYAITNVEYSSLANLADKIYPICAGPEIAVASTKAYSAMLAVLYLLANFERPKNDLLRNIREISTQFCNKISQELIQKVAKSKRVFFIGRNTDGVTANEGALKLKEIAYLDACGYYAGELKHGTIALIEPKVTVIAIITNNLKSKTLNAVEEVLSRGANVIVVSNEKNIKGNFDIIEVPKIAEEELQNIVNTIPLQKLAYEVSKTLGYNPDKPRNLAKSVTVE